MVDTPIVGITGTPGHSSALTASMGPITSGRSGEAGAVASPSRVSVTFSLGPAISVSLRVTKPRSSSGNIRQLTLALALCASALGAWPAFSIVATHVVRSSPTMLDTFDRRSMASGAGLALAISRMSLAIWPDCSAALRSK